MCSEARRGQDPWPVLDEVLGLATQTETLQRLAPVRAALPDHSAPRAQAAHRDSRGRQALPARKGRVVRPGRKVHPGPQVRGAIKATRARSKSEGEGS